MVSNRVEEIPGIIEYFDLISVTCFDNTVTFSNKAVNLLDRRHSRTVGVMEYEVASLNSKKYTFQIRRRKVFVGTTVH